MAAGACGPESARAARRALRARFACARSGGCRPLGRCAPSPRPTPHSRPSRRPTPGAWASACRGRHCCALAAKAAQGFAEAPRATFRVGRWSVTWPGLAAVAASGGRFAAAPAAKPAPLRDSGTAWLPAPTPGGHRRAAGRRQAPCPDPLWYAGLRAVGPLFAHFASAVAPGPLPLRASARRGPPAPGFAAPVRRIAPSLAALGRRGRASLAAPPLSRSATCAPPLAAPRALAGPDCPGPGLCPLRASVAALWSPLLPPSVSLGQRVAPRGVRCAPASRLRARWAPRPAPQRGRWPRFFSRGGRGFFARFARCSRAPAPAALGLRGCGRAPAVQCVPFLPRCLGFRIRLRRSLRPGALLLPLSWVPPCLPPAPAAPSGGSRGARA